ncbi:MAG: restriction endonuclease subunit S, partial [Spirochaetales bacterium]|nr:restriction endonuclease subunit S [Spirochaetales bacterium]
LDKTTEHITQQGLDNSSAKLFSKGTILYSIFATLGEATILNIDATTNQAIAGIKIKDKSSVDIDYFYSFLKSLKDEVNRIGRGVAQNNINLSILKSFFIPLPPLETQKQIAAQLDKCTAVIAKHKQMLEKYDTLIKSRFIEMFGDPVQNPMGWEVKKLGKMCSAIMNGTTPKGGEQVYVENGITFLRSQNVWRNKIDLDDVAYIDEATHKSMKKSSLKKYDILMTKTGRINTENSSLGRAALFLGEDDSANINGHVYLIRLEKEYNHEFVIRILTSPEYRDYIRSICVGGIDKRQVNKDHIEEFPIIQPPKELQDEYSTFVQQIDKSKFAVQKSLEKAETLYKSLIQRYFA